jgi:hypothetical protein
VEPRVVGGRMHVRRDEGAAAPPHGQLALLAEFLAAMGGFERWVSSCPLQYRSSHASDKRRRRWAGSCSNSESSARPWCAETPVTATRASWPSWTAGPWRPSPAARCGAVQGARPLGLPAALHQQTDLLCHRPPATAAGAPGDWATAGSRLNRFTPSDACTARLRCIGARGTVSHHLRRRLNIPVSLRRHHHSPRP